MGLNQGQQDAAKKLFHFVVSDKKEFCLSGPAGVGKTHMLKYIVDNILTEYTNSCKLLNLPQTLKNYAITATTNKAADVLSLATNLPTQTIHSYLNLMVYNDYENGKTKIGKTKSWMKISNTIVFVDEASMIDPILHKFIHETLDDTCKIIYIGDHCQMAPVFHKISPIYDNPPMFVELTEPVRNANQPRLKDLCDQLRTTVQTGKFAPIREFPGVIDYVDDDQMKDILHTKFLDEDINSRILCFTNSRVHEFNHYIRGVRGYADTYQKDEILINNLAMVEGKPSLSVDQMVKIDRITQPPTTMLIDDSDPNSQMGYYKAILTNPDGYHKVFQKEVMIPTDQNQYTQLINRFKNQKNWRRYFYLKNYYCDLRQKDASTVYKAQGSTYDSVVIDLGNISECRDYDQVARMLYVAASRASNRIYLFGKLASRYT